LSKQQITEMAVMRIIFERNVSLKGIPGKQYRVESETAPGYFRIYSAKRRVYFVSYAAEKISEETATKFLNSFLIKSQ
jgi:hypothetical protein